MGMFVTCVRVFYLFWIKRFFWVLAAINCLLVTNAVADLHEVSDKELSLSMARANIPGFPLLDGVDFNSSETGIEVDLDVQASIESIEWIDDDGYVGLDGELGEVGSLILKGLHIGSSQSPITAEQVRNPTPFASNELAMIHGMLVEADPEKGSLITINKLGDTQGNGIDLIVNDIYFGKDTSAQGLRGLGLLLEDISNFISDEYVEKINSLFNLKLATVDDGMNTVGGNYYPLKIRMQPLDGSQDLINSPVDINDGVVQSDISDLFSVPGLTDTEILIDAQFVLYVDKIAVYKEDWEAGIQGFMIYQGVDTNLDGFEDTIGPATLSDLKIQTVQHELHSGSQVQALHFSNINFKAEIAMANIYIGKPETGSLGAIHINDLHIKDTQMWVYPH